MKFLPNYDSIRHLPEICKYICSSLRKHV